MPNQPGSIVMKSGPSVPFSAPGKRSALQKVQKILGLRTLTPKKLKEAHAETIRFGKKLEEIFPDRRCRTKDRRKDQQRDENRVVPKKNEGMDVGRRRHYVPVTARAA